MGLRAPFQHEPGAALDEQATESVKPKKRGRRGGRRRGKSAQIAKQINRVARERQDAQRRGDAFAAQRLTTDLNGRDYVMAPEGLYAEGRDLDAGTMEPGNPRTSAAFRLLHEYGRRTGKPEGASE